MDVLFDHMVSLPYIFQRVEAVSRRIPTAQRRLEADDLLQTCQNIENSLTRWYAAVLTLTCQYPSEPLSVKSSRRPHASRTPTPVATVLPSMESSTPSHSELDANFLEETPHLVLAPRRPYWPEAQDNGLEKHLPFQDQYAFKDGHTCLAFIHHWAAKILLFRCIAQLHSVIVEPVMIQDATECQTSRSVQIDVQNVCFLAGYGIPTTSAAAYSVPTNISPTIDMSSITGVMGMSSEEQVDQMSQSDPMQQMAPFQPATLYCFGPEDGMAGMSHHAAVTLTSEPMHQIPTQAPIPQIPTSQLLTPPRMPGSVQAYVGAADPSPYSDTALKKLADRICRSLGYALAHSTANFHPDSLASPLKVVENLYRELRERAHKNTDLELVWCSWFRSKVFQRKLEIERSIVRDRDWAHEASW